VSFMPSSEVEGFVPPFFDELNQEKVAEAAA
jgi:hypothetical protein